jgi:hypothetical protein
MQTTTQLRKTWPVLTRPSAHASTSRLLPVKSSAPATTTISSPRENTAPPKNWDAAKPRPASARTITESIDPSPMKAPASTPSMTSGANASFAFAAPTAWIRCAISAGAKASNP